MAKQITIVTQRFAGVGDKKELINTVEYVHDIDAGVTGNFKVDDVPVERVNVNELNQAMAAKLDEQAAKAQVK